MLSQIVVVKELLGKELVEPRPQPPSDDLMDNLKFVKFLEYLPLLG